MIWRWVLVFYGVSLGSNFLLSQTVQGEESPSSLFRTPPTLPLFSASSTRSLFRCTRFVHFAGKQHFCDSFLGKDGENLRPIFETTPLALDSLNRYQANRQNANRWAYASSIGLISVLVARLFLSHTRTPSGHLSAGGWLLYGGLGLSLFSVTYGSIQLIHNETHLSRAVEVYNQEHPRQQIEWDAFHSR